MSGATKCAISLDGTHAILANDTITSVYSLESNNFVAESIQLARAYCVSINSDGSKVSLGYSNSIEMRFKSALYETSKQLFKYTITNATDNSLFDNVEYRNELHKAFERWDDVITDRPDAFPNYQLGVGAVFAYRPTVPQRGTGWATQLESASPRVFGVNSFVKYGELLLNCLEDPENSNKPVAQIDYETILDDGKTNFYWIALHEIGHVIGIGEISYKSQVSQDNQPMNSFDANGTTKFYYTGENALREYRNYFNNQNLIGIPLEDDGGSSTAGSHIEEIGYEINGLFHPGMDKELMTGYTEDDSTSLSRITLGVLEDMGFGVDYTKRDPYENDLGDPTPTPVQPTPTPVQPTPTPEVDPSSMAEGDVLNGCETGYLVKYNGQILV